MDKYSHLIGQTFGDYKLDSYIGKDSSGHKVYKFVCKNCGDTFFTTPYEVIKGRKSTVCTNCQINAAITTLDELDEAFSKKNDDILDPPNHIPADFFNDVDIPDIVHEDEVEGYVDEVLPTTNGLVSITVEKRDLFSVPVYYYLAHAIPSSLRLRGGNISRAIDSFYNMSQCIEDIEEDWMHHEGAVFNVGNVFNLVMGAKDDNGVYHKPTEDTVFTAFKNLALDCFENHIKYLAMPKIACGHNGMDWEDVKKLLVEAFDYVYDNVAGIPDSIAIIVCAP